MALVAQYAPIALDVVAVNIEQLLAMSGTVGLVALVGLLWSASGVASAIFRAVNRAWASPIQARPVGKAVWPGHDFRRRRLSSASPVHWPHREFGPGLAALCPVRHRPAGDRTVALAPALLSVCAFILIYRTMPRTRVGWRDVWLGGLIAGLIWEAASRSLPGTWGNVANYSAIYGSVGAIIAFLLWCYLSGQILLLGAEFTAEYSRWRRAGRPMETRPLGSGWPTGRAQARSRECMIWR